MSMLVQEKSLCGRSLLHPKENISLAKALNLSLIITEISRRSLSAFLKRKFAAFDAPVGDNSCKIRAVRMAIIAKYCDRKAIEHLLKELDAISTNIKNFHEKNRGSSLTEFRIQHGFEFSLSEDIAFLIRAHFLFFVKKAESYDQTDFKLLHKIAPITDSDAKDWIHKIKEQLAKSSVDFVHEQASKMEVRKEILLKMLSERFIKIHEKRPILSNIHSMEVLFTTALREGLCAIFVSPDRTLLFHPNEDKTAFVPRKAEEADVNQPAIVIEGKIISSISFENNEFLPWLLVRASKDPQYLEGKNPEEIPFQEHENDPEIRQEKERFEQYLKKETPLKIEHIFCNTIGNQFGRVLNNPEVPLKNSCKIKVKAERIFCDPLEDQFNKTQHSPEEYPWHSCNWMGDDLNIKPGSCSTRTQQETNREVHY